MNAMQLDMTAEDEAFRAQARDWLIHNRPTAPAPREGQASRTYATDWLAKCAAAGWSGLAWPKEYGGHGLSPARLLIWYEEYARARAPSPLDCTFVALNHAGPTVFARGTEAQKAFHLPRILDGRSIWCQGFSEPGAGSDLASLKTTGRIEGDHLVVNGQKIWSSYADIADYQELLIRTDPGSKRHKGLSWVICDMTLPGITVRPIRNMAGVTHFAEVFYDDVRIPLDAVVGEVNDGWSVAMTTLAFERRTAAMALQLDLSVKVEELIALARPTPGTATAERLADLRAEAAGVRAMTYRTALRDPDTPFDGSLVRLTFAELAQRIERAAMDVLGPDGLTDSHWTHGYLESYSETIAGGTAEIQRNIIAERILGLPREARL
ncbi:alkylation response protein AidB-like acyl-CoA dehydrogenase [Maritimibacter alkaliphilus HTCC2654]|uniref:Putative acyl-CoA dehydrogenase n=2 Tax=Maritimibacter TaxID=404235 RepID=A3VG74_9RHOB|nr:putative acyl-CoA dehydrogenase [Rhodobacterales bacterium HTCC2654] [Maritimibacter alkaliphilus HTCC2654]TYP85757.1 alkylation response protein AidB-like acyl-CoA dehydrogenase [Maritimibacter alkaliphilus HTCC2654]